VGTDDGLYLGILFQELLGAEFAPTSPLQKQERKSALGTLGGLRILLPCSK